MLQLDRLDLIVVADNETDVLSSVDNSVQVPETVGLVERIEPTYEVSGEMYMSAMDHMCCACHGFSVLATGHKDGETRTVLFDVGPYHDIWMANAERLGIDLSQIEAVFLSHWHWDHSGGFEVVIRAIAEARSARGLPQPIVDVHPNRPEQRGLLRGDGELTMLPIDPTFEELAAAGAEVVLNDQDHSIADGFFFGSGEIARNTIFETGLHGHFTLRNGVLEADPLMLDERYLSAIVANRGVTVLSACSHAGIINAATAASTTSDEDLDLVLGGFHLAGKEMEQRIPDTVEALLALDPRLIGPGHCTGWRAKSALAQAFEPSKRYAPSSVGTSYRLSANT